MEVSMPVWEALIRYNVCTAGNSHRIVLCPIFFDPVVYNGSPVFDNSYFIFY
jgi:hypothetical protein